MSSPQKFWGANPKKPLPPIKTNPGGKFIPRWIGVLNPGAPQRGIEKMGGVLKEKNLAGGAPGNETLFPQKIFLFPF